MLMRRFEDGTTRCFYQLAGSGYLSPGTGFLCPLITTAGAQLENPASLECMHACSRPAETSLENRWGKNWTDHDGI